MRALLADSTVHGVAAGLVGTAAMTGTLWLERVVRGGDGPVDYDASPHVLIAASTVLHWTPRTPTQRRALFLAVHWGYGSAVGVGRVAAGVLTGSERAGTTVYLAGCQTMAMTLFPAVGGTAPPWRWRRGVLLSSVGQHAVYALVTSAALRRLTRASGADDRTASSSR